MGSGLKIVVITASKYLLVILFMYAGITKLLDRQAFYTSLLNSPLIPDHKEFINGLSWFVPAVELLLAAILLLTKKLKKAFIGAAILLSIYTLYISSILWLAPYIPCSCAGIIKGASWLQHLIFTVFFLLISLLAISIKNKYHKKY